MVRPRVTTETPTASRDIGIFLEAINAAQFSTNINIVDPYVEGHGLSGNGGVLFQKAGANCSVNYLSNRPKKGFTGNTSLSTGWFGYEIYNASGSTAVFTLPEAENSIGMDFLFTNPEGDTTQISPTASDTILWMGVSSNKDAILRSTSDVLLLKAIATNTWRVEYVTGVVHPEDMTATGIGQPGLKTGAASPSGSVTPRWVGEFYYDSTNKNIYVATGTGNTDWADIT